MCIHVNLNMIWAKSPKRPMLGVQLHDKAFVSLRGIKGASALEQCGFHQTNTGWWFEPL